MNAIIDKTPLEAGCFFHVYNRGINREKLFYKDIHYQKFMKRYEALMNGYLDTYSYCLLPNHYHFLIRLHDSNDPHYERIISNHLNILFSQHALMINREMKRYGSLFCKSFKRIKVKSDYYLKNLVVYIHENPIKHKIISDYKSYPYSSYQEIIRNKPKVTCVHNTVSLFDGIAGLIDYHENKDPVRIFLGKLTIEE